MAEYIDRDDAVAVIEEKQKELCPVGMFSRHAVYGTDREKFDAWEEIIEQIERIPAADVRPVVWGKWTCHRTLEHDGDWWCTACGNELTIYMGNRPDRYKFCPNCGARMEES